MIELAQITSNIHVLKKIPFFLKNISQHSQNRNWSKRWFYNSQCNCFQKTCWFNKNKKPKGTMLPSKSLIHSCLVIHTLQTKHAVEKIFCCYCLDSLVQQKYYKFILTIALKLKLMVRKSSKCLRKVDMLDWKIMKRK